ncbi:arylsulfatase [Croceicoccus sp. F390]|uniref:Arylsulfatase n=1 Tax=Croceicoccus esteveae TaxID=3075597 RepID=A0ABU2ZDJ2_9SPHN|nr:arylsulfatase [Croceicoccus sp. F390]MDT0574670.1 arylsulfatase [Croceicoccus sp. F390]
MKAIDVTHGAVLKAALVIPAAVFLLGAIEPTGPALPRPDQPFDGKIAVAQQDATPAFSSPVRAPSGAPNILLVLTDDVGFGAASTFGGPVPTPNLDRLATRGLLYNRFHTTAMCSPTRAALLTGRNHHAVGNGTVANLTTGYPGYISRIPRSAATVAQILRYSGYNTAMLGKHHNAPEDEVSPAGPFDLWPTGLGFDHFFGFMGAETNQFTPALYRGTQSVPTIEDGVLDKALADEAIRWIHAQQAADPDKPFFLYYSTGSAHAPLQAPAEWIARFSGQFDEGWDAVRGATVKRQIAVGLIPADTTPTTRPEEIAAWDDLDPASRKITARMMEVYAAMLSYQDAQIGRVLDELERMGEFDNTLVMFIEGDNGAAAEAGPLGGTNPMARFANGMEEGERELLEQLDAFGGPLTAGNYANGWAWATSAPFPLVKRHASHLGGMRNGMVVSWPARIPQRGLRQQFTHVTDIMPTILEAAGIAAPSAVDGVTQQPIDGISLAYSFADPDAPERHTTQYFEMLGNRAIYHNGWWANTVPGLSPWSSAKVTQPDATKFAWELYDLRQDFAQSRNLAQQQPERLREMQALFDREAQANLVYPLDARLDMTRFAAAAAQRPVRDRYTYWGAGISIPAVRAAPMLNRSFSLTATLDLPQQPAQGTIAALGSRFGGWSFHMVDGVPAATMAASQLPGDQFTVQADQPLPSGEAVLEYRFTYDGGANGGGELSIIADGKQIGQGRIRRTLSKLPEQTDTFDIGFDADTPVITGPGGGRFTAGISRVDVVPTPRR